MCALVVLHLTRVYGHVLWLGVRSGHAPKTDKRDDSRTNFSLERHANKG